MAGVYTSNEGGAEYVRIYVLCNCMYNSSTIFMHIYIPYHRHSMVVMMMYMMRPPIEVSRKRDAVGPPARRQ